ncbi:M23 family metallopeptidase [Brevibacillus humidisoli]|uniref:M23 family metallopeptidase n=1 Tax=Brevibacillus humidisoli TaxID=2895522 RepID=UPI001E2CD59D|nr:M23 family metallopeptidase [Brevibacillus humidisoli]UFJ40143.1 M23 family metallopeptidase [Brevibacillus humidisoli]
MEDQKNQKQPIPFKKTSAWRSFLGKKWAFPAIYIGTAAIILAIVMWYQGTANDTPLDKTDVMDGVTVTTPEDGSQAAVTDETDQSAVPVNTPSQPLAWPVAKDVPFEKGMGFFDDAAPEEEQEKALVQYDGAYTPHTGIDFVAKDEQPFDVMAALDGKVTKVKTDPLVGVLVEIEHSDKMTTVYQSLESASVKPGDEVKQGQLIGKAGRNVYEKDAGVHLHFEVRVDGNAVDPEQYLSKAESQ